MPNNDPYAKSTDIRARLSDWNRRQIQQLLSANGQGPTHVARLLEQADNKAVGRLIQENQNKKYPYRAIVLCYATTHALLRQLAPDFKRPNDLQQELKEFDDSHPQPKLALNAPQQDDKPEVLFLTWDEFVQQFDSFQGIIEFARQHPSQLIVSIVNKLRLSLMNPSMQDKLEIWTCSTWMPNVCGYCGLKLDKPKRCSRCKGIRYCSEACQQAHWIIHKENCK